MFFIFSLEFSFEGSNKGRGQTWKDWGMNGTGVPDVKFPNNQ